MDRLKAIPVYNWGVELEKEQISYLKSLGKTERIKETYEYFKKALNYYRENVDYEVLEDAGGIAAESCGEDLDDLILEMWKDKDINYKKVIIYFIRMYWIGRLSFSEKMIDLIFTSRNFFELNKCDVLEQDCLILLASIYEKNNSKEALNNINEIIQNIRKGEKYNHDWAFQYIYEPLKSIPIEV